MGGILRSFELPVDSNAVRIVPFGITADWLRNLFWLRWRLFSLIQPLALPMLMVLAIALSTRRRLAAVVLVCFVILSAGITSLQFQGRHNFHVELMAYSDFAAVCGGLMTVVSSSNQAAATRSRPELRVIPAALFAIALAAAIVLPVVLLRVYQSRSVSALLGGYDSAPVSPIDVHERTSHGIVYLEMPSLSPTSARSATEMLVTTLDANLCRDSVDLTFRYTNDVRGMSVFTRPLPVDLRAFEGQGTKVMFPAYSRTSRAKDEHRMSG